MSFGWMPLEMFEILVFEEIELLAVAESVVFHGLPGGLVDPLLLCAESLAGFLSGDLADGGVEAADGAVGVFLDAHSLVAELDPQGIHLFFKLIHFTCYIWRFRQRNGCHTPSPNVTRFRSDEQSCMGITAAMRLCKGIKNARKFVRADTATHQNDYSLRWHCKVRNFFWIVQEFGRNFF